MRALVLGATGQIGYAICRSLLDQGHEVIACHRGRQPLQEDLSLAGCREVVGDRHGGGAVEQALQDGADLLVDVIPLVPADAEQLILVSSGFGSIVAVSTAAIYADDKGRTLGTAQQTGFPEFPEPISESQRTVEPDDETYAGRKVAIEQVLLDRSKARTIVLRPCAVHGTYARDLREVWFLKRLLDGRKHIPLAYEGRSCFHTCAAATIAAAALGASAAGGNRVLNVADGDAPTLMEIGETLLGEKADALLPFPGPPRDWVGMSPWSVPTPMRLDTAALSDLVGPLPFYRDTVAPAAAWALAQLAGDWAKAFPKLAAYPFPLFDYAAEDACLRSLAKQS